MKYHSKSLKYSLLTASFLLASLGAAEAKCPPLGRDDVRDICRWEVLGKLPGVQAGKKTIGNVTLQNIGECGEKKSITEFFKKNPQKTFYVGNVAKDLHNPSKIYCIYNIDNHLLKFGATGINLQKENVKPEEPAVSHTTEEAHPETHPKKPKTVHGFDMTTGKMGEVSIQNQPVKESTVRAHPPQTTQQHPSKPLRRPLPETPDTTTEERRPPNYPPPKAPNQAPPRPSMPVPSDNQ